MIQITNEALSQLQGFFASRTVNPSVRVYLPLNSCSSELALRLDDPREEDFKTTHGTLTLLIRKHLLEKTGKVTIDYKTVGNETGFVVETEKILPIVQNRKSCTTCPGC
ncbi:MAG: IscA/HesB family protein [Deltaproteobacteria bacterium]|jgi:Fe-S cluster assembly iron-binding protein IscA|nr:IscA/HesB family protein [Deltaproteobacteria bacterium]